MRKPPDKWDRLLWAVEFRSVEPPFETSFLLGAAWHDGWRMTYDGEPSRTLLFRTRKHASDWCKENEKRVARHSPHWRFRPVRVRETVAEIRKEAA